MGWTGYSGMTAEEAVRYELRGTDIIAHTGAWWLTRWNGYVSLFHALTQRNDGEVSVKLVHASEGPLGTPPKAIFRRWLRESAGQERGQFEWGFIQRVEQEHEAASALGDLKPGDTFSFAREVEFTDGVKETTFVYDGKFRARRACDNAVIRLPRNFRKRIALGGVSS